MNHASKQANHYSPAYLAVAVVLSLVFIFSITSVQVSAASKTVPLDTAAASEDIYTGADESSPKATDFGVNLATPLDSKTTRLDDGDVSGVSGYNWRANFPKLCSGAQLQSIHLVTDSSAQNETGLSGIFLAVYRTDNLVPINNYSINVGEDGNTWAPTAFGQATIPFVYRGIGDGVNTFPASLGFDGRIDAVWDITGYEQNDVGIYIQQIVDNSVTAQTTIESIDLTYDDTNCVRAASQASASDTSNDTTNSAQLAATGTNTDSINLIATTLLITSATTFVMKRKASL